MHVISYPEYLIQPRLPTFNMGNPLGDMYCWGLAESPAASGIYSNPAATETTETQNPKLTN